MAEYRTKKEFIDQHFDIEGMIEIGMFQKGWSYDQMAERICVFFGLKNLYMYELIVEKMEGKHAPSVKADLNTFSKN